MNSEGEGIPELNGLAVVTLLSQLERGALFSSKPGQVDSKTAYDEMQEIIK